MYHEMALSRSSSHGFSPVISQRHSSLLRKNKNEEDKTAIKKVLQFIGVVLRLMRVPILMATAVAFAGIMARTWVENAHAVTMPKWVQLVKISGALLAVLCTAGYANGINQIFDVEIDKINKPHAYPLASEELSLQLAWLLVMGFVTIAITVPILVKSPPLLMHVLYLIVLGSLYSVPPFSMKRSTFGAILIFALAGLEYPLGLSSAATSLLGLPYEFSAQMIFLSIFFGIYSLVAGALKDIEDLEGDKECNVPTLALIYGPRKIALVCCGSLLLNYAGAIIISILMPQAFKQRIMIPAHAVLASFLIFQIWKMEKGNYNKVVSQEVYRNIMKLQFIDYILLPFI